jgi:hypothetical protein
MNEGSGSIAREGQLRHITHSLVTTPLSTWLADTILKRTCLIIAHTVADDYSHWMILMM